MTKKEFNLSEKRRHNNVLKYEFYLDEDVKDFIDRVKVLITFYGDVAITKEEMLKGIDKLAGDKLI